MSVGQGHPLKVLEEETPVCVGVKVLSPSSPAIKGTVRCAGAPFGGPSSWHRDPEGLWGPVLSEPGLALVFQEGRCGPTRWPTQWFHFHFQSLVGEDNAMKCG